MVCYDTYDVGALLKKGKNAVGIIHGNGYSNQTIGVWSYNKCSFRAPLSVALTLVAEGEGLSFSLDTDERSPVIYNMYRNGTSYDARLEIDGWCEGSFDDSSWKNALTVNAPLGEIIPCTATPISVRDELAPISIERQENFYYCKDSRTGDKVLDNAYTEGGYLYDFGINTAGVCRLRIKGERGQRSAILCHARSRVLVIDRYHRRGIVYNKTYRYFHRQIPPNFKLHLYFITNCAIIQ
jgi:alpha-L-rhamnosidase